MNRSTLVFLIALVSNVCAAQQVITVEDDRGKPVQSNVFVDGKRLRNTNDNGVLSVTQEECGGGADVTAEPIKDKQYYVLPSSTGHCTGEPVSVMLTREIVLASAKQWIRQASESENWGVAAHALNEQYGLIRAGSPEEAEQVKRNLLLASARVVGVDPATAIRFDSGQNTSVMDENFMRALVAWKTERGVVDPTTRLDNQFFFLASGYSSGDIRHHNPN